MAFPVNQERRLAQSGSYCHYVKGVDTGICELTATTFWDSRVHLL